MNEEVMTVAEVEVAATVTATHPSMSEGDNDDARSDVAEDLFGAVASSQTEGEGGEGGERDSSRHSEAENRQEEDETSHETCHCPIPMLLHHCPPWTIPPPGRRP